MCYYDQVRWLCGYWRWGTFRQQCNKERRIGETCGLKLVFQTTYMNECCKLCSQLEKKSRRLDKLGRDIDRWRRDGNRPATVEKTERDMQEIEEEVQKLWKEHAERQSTIH